MNINEILKSDYDLLCKDYKKAQEIERLNNIIKEVRRYIGSKEHYEDAFDTEIEKINKIIDKK